jgi:hypothetical protein|tara:strand:+ start:506 stop:1369 length:864 start_codon:yes stop_codon:yes gene_type:complete
MKVDFFIVGAPKAGTTSLYHYLNEHPQVVMSSQKEPDYFSDKEIQEQGMYYAKSRVNTLDKYKSLFVQKESVVYGEASVSYLFYENVAEDIKKYNPNAKIIIILRNPIERAFSHYLMDYRLGLISVSFEKVLAKISKLKNAHLFYQQYIELGKYTTQIQRYLDSFEQESILFIDYDDFKKNVPETVNQVYSFLNISTDFTANINTKYNASTMPKNKIIRFIYSFVFLRKILTFLFPVYLVRNIRDFLFKADEKPELLKETRNQLRKIFNDDIRILEEVLGKDYSKWV